MEINLQAMLSIRTLRVRAIRSGALAFLLASIPLASNEPLGQGVAVRHLEGLVHGFLVLRTLQGETLATGELTQINLGTRLTSHLLFRFKDGSTHEESAVFSQRRYFRLISDHLIQKGPTFKHATDVSIDGVAGQITVRYVDDLGKEKVLTEYVEVPPDLANGIIPILIKNIPPNSMQSTFSFFVMNPKPRLVKLEVTPQEKDTFSIGETSRKAKHYVMKMKIGGVAGKVAPLVGKQPPDTHIWILGEEAPVMIKSEGPLYDGGPIWRIELVSPVGPKNNSDNRENQP